MEKIQGKKQNKLVFEKSPYLLQHSSNPVDWYPWGPEVFEKAKSENKPIFLSIGYSTCHWCHVMAHESFEDSAVAHLMNDAFVSIKVDREERPDIDAFYMTVCQYMTGSGGWPLSIIMTPDKQPFFAGTYIPKETRFGRTGLMDIIPGVQKIWATRQTEVLDSSDQIKTALQQMSQPLPGNCDLGEPALHLAFKELQQRFDHTYGGFGTVPKFPTPHQLLFLLRYWKRTADSQALEMVEKTLQALRSGGIYDQVGFGLHRYSTDQFWIVPHFEKMLYDQALLAVAYLETFQTTGKPEYAQTAREIFTYVLRDMTSPEGGFYSAEDADSEGQEGKFYLWTLNEIKIVLAPDELALGLKIFNVDENGNFSDEVSGENTHNNILHQPRPLEEIAAESSISVMELEEHVKSIRAKLFANRELRVRPSKDDKILVDWNGLMIAAFSKGARILNEPRYAAAARQAVDFIIINMVDKDDRLLHRYRDGQAAFPAHVDDYAFLIYGMLELYETTFDTAYLKQALALNTLLLKHFWDAKNGGFFFIADDAEQLTLRQKEIYDGAVPSGNSVAMLNLLRLGRLTADPELEKKAAKIGRAFHTVSQSPSAFTQLLIAVDFAVGPSYEVVIAGDSQAKDTREMLQAINREFIPNKVLVLVPTETDASEIASLAPYTETVSSINGKATAYVCLNFNCRLPTTDITVMLKLLKTNNLPSTTN